MPFSVGEVSEGMERSIARCLGVESSVLPRGHRHVIVADGDRDGVLRVARLESWREGSRTYLRPLTHADVIAMLATGDVELDAGVVYDKEDERLYLPLVPLRGIAEFAIGTERRMIVGRITPDGDIVETVVVVVNDDDELLIERGIEGPELVQMVRRGEAALADGITLNAARLYGRADGGKNLYAVAAA